MPNSIFLFTVDAHPSDISPRAVIQHHYKRAAALLRHLSGAEHHRHLVYHLSVLRALFSYHRKAMTLLPCSSLPLPCLG
jgi:hypothetical protein